MHKIRTTMQPDVEIEVGDTEYKDLKANGLIVDDSADSPQDELAKESVTGIGPKATPAKATPQQNSATESTEA